MTAPSSEKPPANAESAFAAAREQSIAGERLAAKLLVAAGISEIARNVGVTAVLTGGTAIDFYVAETLDKAADRNMRPDLSIDVDIVTLEADGMSGAIRLRQALAAAGLHPAGADLSPVAVRTERGWRHPDVPIPVEILGSDFDGDPARVIIVDVDAWEIRIRGPEDTIWERAEWGWHTGDQRAWTQALAVMECQRHHVDKAYFRRLASERRYEQAAEAVLRGEALPNVERVRGRLQDED